MTNYYIRTTGSDAAAGTTPATAWASLVHAFNTIAAGDTVYIGPGRYYHEDPVRLNFGGTVGLPKVFQGDPYGLNTGDTPGPVLVASRKEMTTGRYNSLMDLGGDPKFLEFHDLVFEGSAAGGMSMINLGDNLGNFGMDGIVFEDCMFFNKGATDKFGSVMLTINYGDGDAPVGKGIRIRRCFFSGDVTLSSDDNLVANYSVDALIESCVFSVAGEINFDNASGTYGITGLTVRNCAFLDHDSTTAKVGLNYPHGVDTSKIHSLVTDGEGKILSSLGGDTTAIKLYYSMAQQETANPYQITDQIGNAVVEGALGPRGCWWGYEANWVYEKWFGIRPFLTWEPLEIWDTKNPAIGGGDPSTIPAVDFYNRPFILNKKGSYLPVGWYNGDYAVTPFSVNVAGGFYTWQDPDVAWTNAAKINEFTSDYAYTSTDGTVGTNYLRIEKPWVRIDASQQIHKVFVRPYLDFASDAGICNMNFYTLNEAENLGGVSWASDPGWTSLHWYPLKEIPTPPAGGWTISDIENLETRIWATGGVRLRICRLVIYIVTKNSPDMGAVSSSGAGHAIETTIVNEGNNSLSITRAGHYQSTIPVIANTAITINVDVRKDSTYTGTAPQLKVFNIPGGTVEQSATHTAAADVWETLAVTFTPTESGFATIRLVSNDTSENGVSYFDNLRWS